MQFTVFYKLMARILNHRFRPHFVSQVIDLNKSEIHVSFVPLSPLHGASWSAGSRGQPTDKVRMYWISSHCPWILLVYFNAL